MPVRAGRSIGTAASDHSRHAAGEPVGPAAHDVVADQVETVDDLNVMLDRANESLRRSIQLAEAAAGQRRQALKEMTKRERRIDRKIAANARLLEQLVGEPPRR